MTLARAQLKRAAGALLDALANEHPKGHQDSKARRYLLQSPGGAPLEVMFEHDAASDVNMWFLDAAAGHLSDGAIPSRLSPAGAGRHSALRTLPQLADADLRCMSPRTISEIGAILDQLLDASTLRGAP